MSTVISSQSPSGPLKSCNILVYTHNHSQVYITKEKYTTMYSLQNVLRPALFKTFCTSPCPLHPPLRPSGPPARAEAMCIRNYFMGFVNIRHYAYWAPSHLRCLHSGGRAGRLLGEAICAHCCLLCSPLHIYGVCIPVDGRVARPAGLDL